MILCDPRNCFLFSLSFFYFFFGGGGGGGGGEGEYKDLQEEQFYLVQTFSYETHLVNSCNLFWSLFKEPKEKRVRKLSTHPHASP